MANNYNIMADYIVSKYIERISGDDITETFVDDLEIIGRWINKLDRSINLNRMSDYQKSCFLTNLISIHLKFVGISSDNEVINILNFFDDEGDILDGINNSKKDTS